MLEFSMILTNNKPERVIKHTATAIDNIITNCRLNMDIKSTIVKTDLSGHFPIIFIDEFKKDLTPTDDMWKCVHKRDFNENEFSRFKQALLEKSWNNVKNLKQPNEAYSFDKYFPI